MLMGYVLLGFIAASRSGDAKKLRASWVLQRRKPVDEMRLCQLDAEARSLPVLRLEQTPVILHCRHQSTLL
jgi:hypothetical protein